MTLQKGSNWTGAGQLFYVPAADLKAAAGDQANPAAPGAAATTQPSASAPFLELDFNVEKEELRRLVLRLTHSYDYGKYRVLLDGKPAAGPFDLYSAEIEVHDLSLGDHKLSPGKHTIRLECVGKNPVSTGTRLGVDSVRLRQRWLKLRPVPKPKS